MKCLFCNKEILSTAIRCKHCRNYLGASSEALLNNETSPWNLNHVIFLYCAAFVLTLLIVIFLIPLLGLMSVNLESKMLMPIVSVISQYAAAIIMIGLIYLSFKRRYEIPFLDALKLGPLKLLSILGLIILGMSLRSLGEYASRILDIGMTSENSFRDAFATSTTTSFFIFYVCVLGPLYEEILFRGVLYPAINKKLGMQLATFYTTVLFSLMHLIERKSLSDSFAYYMAFTYFITWVRAKSGSTSASLVLHIAFNMTGILMLLLHLAK